MKLALLFSAIVLAVCVSAEDCPNNNVQQECTHVTCNTGFHRECVNTVCTCNPNQAVQCTTQNDCQNMPNCYRTPHCIDNHCRCGGGFGK